MRSSVLLCAAALVSPSAALAQDHPADGLVVFINSSSSTVTVMVDGTSICSLDPDEKCSTVLTGDDADYKHLASASTNGRTWTDKISVSDCHWNWLGTKTYTFRDNGVPFECAK
jgi:hypothetical protein